MRQRNHSHGTRNALVTIGVSIVALAGVCWLLRVPLLTLYYLLAFSLA